MEGLCVIAGRTADSQGRVGDRTLIGSLSELLAEPFGVDDTQIIERVKKANSYFDVFVHQLDDVKDNQANGAALAHEAITNLIKGIRYIRCVKKRDVLFDRLFGYWQQASEGEKHLWRHHGKLMPYDSQDFLMLGRRGAMAKTPIALYADASQNDSPVLSLEKGIEEGGIAVQLCDDIFDWEKDLASRIYTHPIVLAFQETGSLDKQQIERTLFSSKVFPSLINNINHYLTRAKESFELASANKLGFCVQGMGDNLSYLAQYLGELESKIIRDNLTKRVMEKANPLVLNH